MKTRQIITAVLEYVDSDHSYRFDDNMCCSEISKLINDYANQRVIEELKKLKIENLGMYNGVEDVNIHKRIKELKK